MWAIENSKILRLTSYLKSNRVSHSIAVLFFLCNFNVLKGECAAGRVNLCTQQLARRAI